MNEPIVINHIEHFAGDFEDGIQVCVNCGEILSDYSGGNWVSCNGTPPLGFPRGPLWVSGKNPTSYSTQQPQSFAYNGDTFICNSKKCTEQ